MLGQIAACLAHARRPMRQIVRITGHHMRQPARQQRVRRLPRRTPEGANHRGRRQLQHAAHVHEGLDDVRVAHHRLVALGVGNEPMHPLIGEHPAGHIRTVRNGPVRKLQQHHLLAVEPADHGQLAAGEHVEHVRMQVNLAAQPHIQRNAGFPQRLPVLGKHGQQRRALVVEHPGVDVRRQHRRMDAVGHGRTRQLQRVLHRP